MANKKTKIIIAVLGVLVAVTAVAAVYFGGGTMFKGSVEITDECGPRNIKGLIPVEEPYTWFGITDELCICDTSANWTINGSIPSNRSCGTDNMSSCIRFEYENKPCVCKPGYIEVENEFKCVKASSQTLETNCIFTSPSSDYCTPNGQCIENSHLVQNKCQCDTGYEFNESSFKCEKTVTALSISSNVVKLTNKSVRLTDVALPQDKGEASQLGEPPVSCDYLVESLSAAFYNKEWESYETIMKDLEEENCFEDTCTPKFYWSVLYISLRDYLKAGLFYNDEDCADCEWYTDLSGYTSNDMSNLDFDDPILRDLAKKTLEACPPPGSYDLFLEMIIDAADLFSTKYFEPEAKDTNRGIAFNFFPVAYAQSTEFSDDVENVLKEEYEDAYGPETVPECRSLEIVKPEDLKLMEGKKLIDLPESGFVDEELAIVVDADADAVYLYRYKSMDGTITFDDEGTVYDTEETSVYMNSIETDKGDIVSVWALDEELDGIKDCQDMLYVSQAPVTEPVTETVYVPAPVVFQPTTQPTTEPVYTYQAPVVHAAAPEVPKNGPEVLLYFAGALAGAFVIKKRKKN